MSRIANNPIAVPDSVEIRVNAAEISIKGSKGELKHKLHTLVELQQEDGRLRLSAKDDSRQARALAGTTRAILQNMVSGVSDGYEIRLDIVGTGYRAEAKSGSLNLLLGFSHPVQVDIPAGLTVETPTQTQIVVKGADKQKVGQLAANIRAYRPPEPYKGKGISYAGERILRKEAKKA